jgi:hypothetical protein
MPEISVTTRSVRDRAIPRSSRSPQLISRAHVTVLKLPLSSYRSTSSSWSSNPKSTESNALENLGNISNVECFNLAPAERCTLGMQVNPLSQL